MQSTLSIQDIFKHLLKVMSSERFLKMEGLNQEVPFFICPFGVKIKKEMEDMLPLLKKNLLDTNVKAFEINLYDLCIDILKADGSFEDLLEAEPDNDKPFFKENLQDMLDVEQHIIPAIEARIEAEGQFDIMFLTGVGEIFPYIRTHNILNNLQRVAKSFPTVLFFPGEYIQSLEKGASLKLFGRLPDDKYYRAYDIMRYMI